MGDPEIALSDRDTEILEEAADISVKFSRRERLVAKVLIHYAHRFDGGIRMLTDKTTDETRLFKQAYILTISGFYGQDMEDTIEGLTLINQDDRERMQGATLELEEFIYGLGESEFLKKAQEVRAKLASGLARYRN